MRLFKNVFDFYLNSSIHVALSVYALSWITLMEYQIDYDENILYFNFFATITGYNFVKFFGLAKFHHRSLANWLKIIQIFSLICFLALCYYAFKLELKTLLWIVAFGAITFLYAIPFLPKHYFLDKQHNLRSVSGLKVYVIAIVWSGVTVFLPLLNNDYDIEFNVVITSIQIALFVVVLMLPFEIRDMKYDSLKLATIPQQIGVKKTKIIGALILMVFFLLEYFKDDIDSNNLLAILMITIITMLFLVFSRENQGKYYSAFWVEGIPVFWLVLLKLLG
ncbi:hypothetical protein C1T31_04215 [Hanstruepera neustonica]|uniref:Prenyltransferase n=1 Tax=Hanstruepera neustonica TaxID=1445657 RepID=A0A2K1E4X8_9FLAO|nr:hypothetical protein [Hanstruepera neustonica]PNQ75342.1 hypothetical protein C1T31_04215 [Hanstruepera neustonica]